MPPNWRSLTEDDYCPVVVPEQAEIDFAQGGPLFGLAVDLGTTQIRISLWNMKNRERLTGRIGPNPQTMYGVDVLSRLTAAASSKQHAWELSWLAKSAISKALQDISAKTEYDIRDIGHVTIVGNTAMLCLLSEKNYDLLLRPENWSREIDCEPGDTTSWKAAWGIDLNAEVKVIRPLAGFIGSDFLAAVIATRLLENRASSLIVDFGANSEIGLWDGDTLRTTSAPGGPAFEGSGISCGLPAEPGAIFKIERLEYTGKIPSGFLYEVIGGVKAKGICGSGLVDVIADLVESGIVNRLGKFTQDVGNEGLPIIKGKVEGEKDINLKEHDIDALQRAKAAIAAGTVYLLQQANTQPMDIKRIYACGAFGRFLNIEHAQEIGLLPPIPSEEVKLYGNAALAGCESLLLAQNRSAILDNMKSKTRVFNLAQYSLFEQDFIENLFLQPMQSRTAGTEHLDQGEAA
jgi:uncharacterized 2Fe-2S/4Fe-4S cluster protein (DUF4445 family)